MRVTSASSRFGRRRAMPAISVACLATSCTRLPRSSRSSWAAYGSTESHRLNSGSSALHTPEVRDIARMMSRKFSGSWKGSERTTSPNCTAKSRNSRGSTSRSSAKPIPPKRANNWVIALSSSDVSADGSSTPTSCIASTRPLPSRAAAAISSLRSPLRVPAPTSPIMPKSMKVSFHGRPSVSPCPFGVTKILPGCGSAWKKPRVNSWSNITAAKTGATSTGSMPAARRASASVILIAVTSCSVSTRRVVRSQTTSGTATRSSPATSSANRTQLAASCR